MAVRIHLPRSWGDGATLVLPPAESRHVQVLRLQPGAAIVLFDGTSDEEWPAEIVRIDRSTVEVRLGDAPTPVARELPIDVTLAVGMPANERMDGLVEKATELGASAVQPLVAERSVVRLAGERAEARRRHWAAVAASASEQCGRARVPHIGTPCRLDDWLAALGPPVEGERRWLLGFAADAVIAGAPESLPEAGRLVVLSGPEGGLSPAEEAAARGRGFAALSLGPRVLRADTAPLAWLAWLGLATRRASA